MFTGSVSGTGGASRAEAFAAETLKWAAGAFGPRLAFATGFGREGCVLIHMIATEKLPVALFTLDTGLLFDETFELWRKLEAAYGVKIEGVRPRLTVAEQAAEAGDELWATNPDLCCELRKVEPLRRYLDGFDAWVTAIRADQTPERAGARPVERDPRFGLVKVNPLLSWTAEDVEAYINRHGIPVNSLHSRGFQSIGCWPCTTPVVDGEDPRAGRWRGRPKRECGLHNRPSKDRSERTQDHV